MYSSNHRSMLVLCLPLTLLSFEGGNRAGTMGEEGLSLLCSFNLRICMKETAYQATYLCQISQESCYLCGFSWNDHLFFHGLK